jgi:hypothetical protein
MQRRDSDSQLKPFADLLSEYENKLNDSDEAASGINPALLKIFDAIIKETSVLFGRKKLDDEDTKKRVALFIEYAWSMCSCKSMKTKDEWARFNFTIRCTLMKRWFDMLATPSCTVAEVKAHLYRYHNIAIENQVLVFNGLVLNDDTNLASYGIVDDSKVDLSLRCFANGENSAMIHSFDESESGDAHQSFGSNDINNLRKVLEFNQNAIDETDEGDITVVTATTASLNMDDETDADSAVDKPKNVRHFATSITSTYRQNKPTLLESTVNQISRVILNALHYISSRNVVHRLIKPRNILFRVNGDIRTLKLASFGLAKIIEGNEMASDFCGSLGYIAPEIYEQKPYRYEVDMFAFVIILFRLLSGVHPFCMANAEKFQCRKVAK